MTSIEAAALWSGLSIALLLVLSVQVVRHRLKQQVGLGDGGHPDLTRAIRAHANAVEYVAPCLAGLVVMALAGLPVWAVHVGGALLFGGRVAHAQGLARSDGATPGRQIGMIATYTAMGFIAVCCVVGAF